MNSLLGYLSVALTCYACMGWNDVQLAAMANQQTDLSVMSSLADVVVSNGSASDMLTGISSGNFSSAQALVTAATNATQAVSGVINQQPEPMVLTALSTLLRSVASTNAAAAYLGGNPAVIKVNQCKDAMQLTRAVMPWPEGWGIVQNPEKPDYSGMLNCYITDGVQYVPITVTTTG